MRRIEHEYAFRVGQDNLRAWILDLRLTDKEKEFVRFVLEFVLGRTRRSNNSPVPVVAIKALIEEGKMQIEIPVLGGTFCLAFLESIRDRFPSATLTIRSGSPLTFIVAFDEEGQG